MIPCRASGFTLIEVLVAALVLAIGIAGVIAAHLGAQRTRHGTALMSGAVQLAAGTAERIAANGRFRDQYAGFDYDSTRDGPPAPSAQACFGTPCSGGQLAAADLAELRQALHAGFPGGRIVICRDAAVAQAGARLAWQCGGGSGAPLAIKIGWIERGAGVDTLPALVLLADGGAP
ncbi:type IV pilus modification protein PilV [Massilia sp. PAMC28688]|uniref:type IV pilus modification protein PilV n=1 Tax=Massilia sp. PAMC28688 TaxID=2861283 RepID=UPI001E54B45E|nr:type IV pilus modification protein PilV [Massilia sp. PAMC28688]